MSKVTRLVEIDEILRSDDFIQGSHRESKDFFGDTLLMLDDHAHFDRRRLESTLFTRAALLYYESHALRPVIDEVMAECRSQQDADGRIRVDLVPLIRTMLHRIAAITTGIDGVDTVEHTERFRWFTEQLADAAQVEWTTEDPETVIKRGLAVREQFVEEYFGHSYARRGQLVADFRAGRIAESDLPRDLLTLLQLHWSDEWDDELPLREASLFLIAALQTTTHAIPHVVAHIMEWVEEHPEDRPKLQDKEFLRRAAYESQRLHAAVPSLLRIAARNVELGTGRKVRTGERMALLLAHGNQDPEAWGADAQEYNPYREPKVPGLKPWGLAFGGGEHLCIGRPLVTGLAGRSDETTTEGTLVGILHTLFGFGLTLDPDQPPEYNNKSYYDAHATFPVILGPIGS